MKGSYGLNSYLLGGKHIPLLSVPKTFKERLLANYLIKENYNMWYHINISCCGKHVGTFPLSQSEF